MVAVFTSASAGVHSISPHTSYSTADAPSCLFGYDGTTLHCPTQPVGLTGSPSPEAASSLQPQPGLLESVLSCPPQHNLLLLLPISTHISTHLKLFLRQSSWVVTPHCPSQRTFLSFCHVAVPGSPDGTDHCPLMRVPAPCHALSGKSPYLLVCLSLAPTEGGGWCPLALALCSSAVFLGGFTQQASPMSQSPTPTVVSLKCL